MDIKQKIQKILRESMEDGGLTVFEQKIFKLLDIHNLSEMSEVTNFLREKVGMKPFDAYSMFLLYKYNWDYDGVGKVKRVDPKSRVVRTANNRARQFVEALIPFKGNNTSGGYQSNGNYVVWSYDWYPLFIYDGKQWYENINKYSVSTSKQTSQLRPYREEIIDKTHSELREML